MVKRLSAPPKPNSYRQNSNRRIAAQEDALSRPLLRKARNDSLQRKHLSKMDYSKVLRKCYSR